MIRSKSGRAHVYMFMKEFTNAEEVQTVMKKFAGKLGLADILDRVYPMQTSLADKKDGSWLNMPYFEGENSVRYGYNPKGVALTPEEFVAYARSQTISHEEVLKLKVPEIDDIEGGPPCLKILLKQGFPEGQNINRSSRCEGRLRWFLK